MLMGTARSTRFFTMVFVGSVGLFLATGTSVFAAGETYFRIVDSSPSSWVARGYSDYMVGPDDGWTVSVDRNFDNGVSLRFDGNPPQGTTVDYWDIDFAAPFDAEIAPGLYPNFQRFPFQDANRPGLSFFSTGRGDNRASGFYEVFEATYAPNGDVLTFSADFTHYGEENQNNWAMVQIRYNIVPEPATGLLLLAGWSAIGLKRRWG